MMDQHDADDPFFAESCKLFGGDLQLMPPKLPAGNERRRLDRRVQSDDRYRPDAPHEGEGQRIVFASHVFGPPRDTRVAVEARIDVVISRHDSDVRRRTYASKPTKRRLVFGRQTEIDEIARDRDMVGAERNRIRYQLIGCLGLVNATPLSNPIGIAKQTLRIPIPPCSTKNRRQVHVGKVRERESLGHVGK